MVSEEAEWVNLEGQFGRTEIGDHTCAWRWRGCCSHFLCFFGIFYFLIMVFCIFWIYRFIFWLLSLCPWNLPMKKYFRGVFVCFCCVCVVCECRFGLYLVVVFRGPYLMSRIKQIGWQEAVILESAFLAPVVTLWPHLMEFLVFPPPCSLFFHISSVSHVLFHTFSCDTPWQYNIFSAHLISNHSFSERW